MKVGPRGTDELRYVIIRRWAVLLPLRQVRRCGSTGKACYSTWEAAKGCSGELRELDGAVLVPYRCVSKVIIGI